MPQDILNTTDTLDQARIKLNGDIAELYTLASGVDNVSSLRALSGSVTPVSGQPVPLEGYYATGDGGEGTIYYDSTDTTTTDNGGTTFVDAASRRWKRSTAKYKNVDVLKFGAKPTSNQADAATNDTAFAAAIAYGKANGDIPVFVPFMGSASYRMSAPIVLDTIGMYSNDKRCTIRFANDLGAATFAIVLKGSVDVGYRYPYLRSLYLEGTNTGFVRGTLPRNGHGVRCGDPTGTADKVKPKLYDVTVRGFNQGVVFDNTTGHIELHGCEIENNFYNLWVRRGNGDYYISATSLTGPMWASIGVPKDTNLNMSTIIRSHLGYGPYGIYQPDSYDSGASNNQTWLYNCNFIGMGMENCGNGGIKSVATGSPLPQMLGNRFWGCQGTLNNASYGASGEPVASYFVDVPYAQSNYVDWGNKQWDEGSAGVIRSESGLGSWTLRGHDKSTLAGSYFSAATNTNYNEVQFHAAQPLQLTIPSGTTTVTHTFSKPQLAMLNGIRPTVTPTSNPGSHHWVTTTSTTMTINLASAPGSNVVFNVHLSAKYGG